MTFLTNSRAIQGKHGGREPLDGGPGGLPHIFPCPFSSSAMCLTGTSRLVGSHLISPLSLGGMSRLDSSRQDLERQDPCMSPVGSQTCPLQGPPRSLQGARQQAGVRMNKRRAQRCNWDVWLLSWSPVRGLSCAQWQTRVWPSPGPGCRRCPGRAVWPGGAPDEPLAGADSRLSLSRDLQRPPQVPTDNSVEGPPNVWSPVGTQEMVTRFHHGKRTGELPQLSNTESVRAGRC